MKKKDNCCSDSYLELQKAKKTAGSLSKIFGFALAEIIISFIVISVIAAISAPILFKKMGGIKINGIKQIKNTECSANGLSADCKLCKITKTEKKCILCTKKCALNQFLDKEKCQCHSCKEYDPKSVTGDASMGGIDKKRYYNNAYNTNFENTKNGSTSCRDKVCCTRCDFGFCKGCNEGVGMVGGVCRVCQKGQVSNLKNNADACKKCNSGGEYQDEIRKTECKNCDAGYYCPPEYCQQANSSSVKNKCPDPNGDACKALKKKGYTCPSKDVCKNGCPDKYPCPPGYKCPGGGNTYPEPCGKGFYQGEVQKTSCNECNIGHYCPSETTVEQTKCPSNTTTKGVNCGSKILGKQCKNIGNCLCVPGKFLRKAACNSLKDKSSDSCKVTANTDICEDCAEGTYKANVGNGKMLCYDCPEGNMCPERGSTEPKKCEDGTFQPKKGQTECPDCPPGHYCPNPTQKISCPIGMHTNGGRKTSINDCICNTGTYKNAEGQCVDCHSEGLYCPGDGSWKYCHEISPNCNTCDSTTGVCNSCKDGFISDGRGGCRQPNCNGIGGFLVNAGGNYICVQQYNPSASDISSRGISVVSTTDAYSVWHNKTDQLHDQCWYGTTSYDNSSDFEKSTREWKACDNKGGGYDGCSRVVCTKNAANAYCSLIGWRLPTEDEASYFGNYSTQLNLCYSSWYHKSYDHSWCVATTHCQNAYEGTCRPGGIWTLGTPYELSGVKEMSSGVDGIQWSRAINANNQEGLSVRCVHNAN